MGSAGGQGGSVATGINRATDSGSCDGRNGTC